MSRWEDELDRVLQYTRPDREYVSELLSSSVGLYPSDAVDWTDAIIRWRAPRYPDQTTAEGYTLAEVKVAAQQYGDRVRARDGLRPRFVRGDLQVILQRNRNRSIQEVQRQRSMPREEPREMLGMRAKNGQRARVLRAMMDREPIAPEDREIEAWLRLHFEEGARQCRDAQGKE